MKKLTAGIFASILGLTAMGAADAAVTSKAYVDGLVGGINTSLESKAEQSALNQEIADRQSADSAIEAAYKAADNSLQSQIDGKVAATQATTNGVVTTDATGKVQVSATISQEQVTGLKAALSALPTDTTVAGKVDKDQGSGSANNVVIVGENGFVTTVPQIGQDKVTGLTDALGAKADSQTVTELATEVAGKADTSALNSYVLTETFTQSQTAQTNALEAKINAKADAGSVYTKTEVDASQKTQDDAISALQTKTADMATTADVNTAKAGAISEAAADAATKYAAIAYEDKVDALDASQETQDTAITALEQFETSVKDAVKTVNNEEGTGEYALTMKLVDDGTGTGAKKPEFVWEQIVRQ